MYHPQIDPRRRSASLHRKMSSGNFRVDFNDARETAYLRRGGSSRAMRSASRQQTLRPIHALWHATRAVDHADFLSRFRPLSSAMSMGPIENSPACDFRVSSRK